MPNEQLLAYIRSELARDIDKTTLIQSLLATGWKVEDINAAMTTIDGGPNQNVPPVHQASQSQQVTASAAPAIKYAGFWVRVAATLVDSLIVGVPYILIILAVSFAGVENGIVLMLVYGIPEIFAYAYYILMLSTYQATLGKMAVGLRVERTNGEKIGFWRAVLREIFGKFVSGITFGIGFFMVGWTQKKQGLHDKIADTVVIERDPNKSKTVWIIIAVVMALALPVIGVFASITLASLNAARMKGADAAVRMHMSTVAVQAELYYGIYDEGYLGYCTSSQALPELSDASRSGSTDGSTTFYMCNDSKEEYAASAPLKSGGYVCVDSMGASVSTVVEQFLPSGTYVCPPAITDSTTFSGDALSKSDRDDFIRGSTDSCVEMLVDGPSGGEISRSSIVAYCSCFSSKVADETTTTELKEIIGLAEDDPLPPYMEERTAVASQACASLLVQ